MPRRYQGDPHWITTRYPGQCAGCRTEIAAGEEAFRFKSGSLYGKACGCGDRESSGFEAAAMDEDMMAGSLR